MSANAPENGVVIEAWEDGCVFHVKAHPGARRDGIAGCHDGMLKVEVTAAPEKGKANKAIARILAKGLGVASSSVVLLSGETSAKKRFAVRGLPPAAMRARLSK